MKSIVVVTGSPRESGNTNILAGAFVAEAEKLGMTVTTFDIKTMNISPCHACEGCVATKECVVEDDFKQIAEALKNANGIVLVSPVYWYSFSTQIKAVVDRFFSLYSAGQLFEGKKCALISCCAEADAETFTGIKFSFDKTIELMKGQIVGEVLVPGVTEPGDVNKTDGVEQAKALAHKFA